MKFSFHQFKRQSRQWVIWLLPLLFLSFLFFIPTYSLLSTCDNANNNFCDQGIVTGAFAISIIILYLGVMFTKQTSFLNE